MRVVAGKYRSIPLKTLDSISTRPTKDMVKEALFSSLQIKENCIFLDLFAGSGAIGIEALSRGAKEVYFNDFNKDACNIIKENLLKVKEPTNHILNLDYEACLHKLKGIKFDYIFLDPPYKFQYYDELFRLIDSNNLLNEEGIIIVEVRKEVELEESYLNIKQYKNKKYGISKLLYYKR